MKNSKIITLLALSSLLFTGCGPSRPKKPSSSSSSMSEVETNQATSTSENNIITSETTTSETSTSEPLIYAPFILIDEDSENLISDYQQEMKLINLLKNKEYMAFLDNLIRYYAGEHAKQIGNEDHYLGAAQNELNALKKDIKNSCIENNLNYEEQFQLELEEIGVKNEEELLIYFYQEIAKDSYIDNLLANNSDTFVKNCIGIDEKGEKIGDSPKYFYHVNHILSSINDINNTNHLGDDGEHYYQISTQEIERIFNIVSMLSSGHSTFGQTAYSFSCDPSARYYGDAGIMASNTSFINEFKLGSYVFDLLNKDNDYCEKYKGILGIDDTLSGTNITPRQYFKDLPYRKIPYQAFLDLKQAIKDNVEHESYPYGIYKKDAIFTKYFGVRMPFVITNEGYADKAASDNLTAGFKDIPNEGKLLCDEAGRIIYGSISEYGIHLMRIYRSPFEKGSQIDRINGEKVYDDVTLNEYYTTHIPGDSKYPVDVNGKDKHTYINYINETRSTYIERSNTIKQEIKYNYSFKFDILQSMIDKGIFQFVDDDVKQDFAKFKQSFYQKVNQGNNEYFQYAWQDYITNIQLDKINVDKVKIY